MYTKIDTERTKIPRSFDHDLLGVCKRNEIIIVTKQYACAWASSQSIVVSGQ